MFDSFVDSDEEKEEDLISRSPPSKRPKLTKAAAVINPDPDHEHDDFGYDGGDFAR